MTPVTTLECFCVGTTDEKYAVELRDEMNKAILLNRKIAEIETILNNLIPVGYLIDKAKDNIGVLKSKLVLVERRIKTLKELLYTDRLRKLLEELESSSSTL